MEGQFVSEGKSYTPGKMFDGHYRLIRLLSDKRAAIAVWLARDVNTIDKSASANDESSGKLVSIMICHPTTALDIEDEQRWQDEFDAAHDCLHPNLLPPEEYAICNDSYYLVFPYTNTVSLRQFIGKDVPDKVAWKFILSLSSGLDELHNHQPQIIHNDIKPSNILVYDNESFVLTNYGIHFETDIQRIDNHSDSLAYMAPERFHGISVPHPENDIWAFGATLYEVLSGNRPFGEQGGKNQRPDTPLPPLPNYPDEIRDLVYACLQYDPKKRPTAQQIKDAARSKKILAKPKKKNLVGRTNEPSGNNNLKKKSIAIAATALLFIGVLVYVLIPQPDEEPKEEEKEEVVVVNNYEKTLSLLLDENTAEIGRKMLDSLVKANDWQATFLLSRLYFDTRGVDTILYDKRWEKMRDNCGITPDNKMAHKYLFDAFKLNENDFMILYQLGLDFKAGPVRGCDRKLNYALWCFDHADSCVNHTQYRHELELGRDRIMNYSPLKPSR